MTTPIDYHQVVLISEDDYRKLCAIAEEADSSIEAVLHHAIEEMTS